VGARNIDTLVLFAVGVGAAGNTHALVLFFEGVGEGKII
jgi:hypothetical protein